MNVPQATKPYRQTYDPLMFSKLANNLRLTAWCSLPPPSEHWITYSMICFLEVDLFKHAISFVTVLEQSAMTLPCNILQVLSPSNATTVVLGFIS